MMTMPTGPAEKTCGAVVYTQRDGQFLFLLVKSDSGHIGFPKGHVEPGETETETALREIFEETGLRVVLKPDFRMEYTYETLEHTLKNCVYFRAPYILRPAVFQPEEVIASWLVPYREAMSLLNFPQDKKILEAVWRCVAI